jgi:hypothetical protein
MTVSGNVPGHPEPMRAREGDPEQCRRFGNRLLTVLLGREGRRVNARGVCFSSGGYCGPPASGVGGREVILADSRSASPASSGATD